SGLLSSGGGTGIPEAGSSFFSLPGAPRSRGSVCFFGGGPSDLLSLGRSGFFSGAGGSAGGGSAFFSGAVEGELFSPPVGTGGAGGSAFFSFGGSCAFLPLCWARGRDFPGAFGGATASSGAVAGWSASAGSAAGGGSRSLRATTMPARQR